MRHGRDRWLPELGAFTPGKCSRQVSCRNVFAHCRGPQMGTKYECALRLEILGCGADRARRDGGRRLRRLALASLQSAPSPGGWIASQCHGGKRHSRSGNTADRCALGMAADFGCASADRGRRWPPNHSVVTLRVQKPGALPARPHVGICDDAVPPLTWHLSSTCSH